MLGVRLIWFQLTLVLARPWITFPSGTLEAIISGCPPATLQTSGLTACRCLLTLSSIVNFIQKTLLPQLFLDESPLTEVAVEQPFTVAGTAHLQRFCVHRGDEAFDGRRSLPKALEEQNQAPRPP